MSKLTLVTRLSQQANIGIWDMGIVADTVRPIGIGPDLGGKKTGSAGAEPTGSHSAEPRAADDRHRQLDTNTAEGLRPGEARSTGC